MKKDEIAKKMVKQGTIGPTKYQVAREPWVCHMRGNRLVKEIATKLWTNINQITIEAHWEKKGQYKAGHHRMMDFEMAGRALRSIPKAQQWWAVKTAAKFLPYDTNMTQWLEDADN